MALHPGLVRTNIFNNFSSSLCYKLLYYLCVNPIFYYFAKTLNQGAQTTLYCCLIEYDNLKGGKYYEVKFIN